jgi:hypothetical protein
VAVSGLIAAAAFVWDDFSLLDAAHVRLKLLRIRAMLSPKISNNYESAWPDEFLSSSLKRVAFLPSSAWGPKSGVQKVAFPS